MTAFVDWLTVTFDPEPGLDLSHDVWSSLSSWTRGPVVGRECPGRYGYEHGVEFHAPVFGSLVSIGRLDWGGERHGGRARLDLSGAGCSRVDDWWPVRRWIALQDEATLTRVDLAVDCLEGEFSVEDAREWYEEGEFHCGGRVPRHSCVGDWLNPSYEKGEGIRYGRTLEVGRRVNGKMLRAYEKGRQLGDSSSVWTRFEVELRNIDRDLPLDALTDCDRYFAGAYVALQRLVTVEGERIRTHQAEGEIQLGQLVQFTRSAYGQLVNVLRAKLDAGVVLDLLCREGVPRRLHRASLTAFHQFGADALLLERDLQ